MPRRARSSCGARSCSTRRTSRAGRCSIRSGCSGCWRSASAARSRPGAPSRGRGRERARAAGRDPAGRAVPGAAGGAAASALCTRAQRRGVHSVRGPPVLRGVARRPRRRCSSAGCAACSAASARRWRASPTARPSWPGSTSSCMEDSRRDPLTGMRNRRALADELPGLEARPPGARRPAGRRALRRRPLQGLQRRARPSRRRPGAAGDRGDVRGRAARRGTWRTGSAARSCCSCCRAPSSRGAGGRRAGARGGRGARRCPTRRASAACSPSRSASPPGDGGYGDAARPRRRRALRGQARGPQPRGRRRRDRAAPRRRVPRSGSTPRRPMPRHLRSMLARLARRRGRAGA